MKRKFESCVNDLALRLGLMERSSDFILTQILALLSRREKAVATVLDNFDQPLLSEKMRKVSTGIWKRQSNGHMLITTIHEKKEICHCVNLETSCCVKVFSFPTDEP